LPVASAELAEELPHVADGEAGYFQGGEVAAAAEFGPPSATSASSSRQRLAIACPIPDVAPVTSTADAQTVT
jgi:hypothetical protein